MEVLNHVLCRPPTAANKVKNVCVVQELDTINEGESESRIETLCKIGLCHEEN